jgi:glycosyltransferase involved in cell wall biosynthesis
MITEKISVLFDAHNLGKKAGGIETYNRNLLRNLRGQKKTNLFLYTNKKTNFHPKKDAFVPFLDSGAYRILFGFGRAIKRFHPDIIHTNNFLPFFAPKKVKKVVTIHDLCFLKEKKPFERALFKALLFYSLSNADRIIAVSRFTKKQILNFMGKKLSFAKISTVHNGVDNTFKPVKKDAVCRYLGRKYKINKDFFLVSGNMTPRKNLPLIIFLSQYLKEKHPSIKMVISGKKEAGIPSSYPNNLIFLNYVAEKDLNYLYNACLGLLFPSTCEGFGLPVIEAARTKTPVVASPIAVVKEVAGNTVLYAKGKSEWVKALNRIIKDRYPKALIAKAQKNSFKFSWERAARETAAIYEATL